MIIDLDTLVAILCRYGNEEIKTLGNQAAKGKQAIE
jgi:hypothetical protein